jgi:hypothetical protein
MGRLGLPLLVLVTAALGGDDRPERKADADLQARINGAITKGIAYLKSIQQGDGSWPYPAAPQAEDMTAGLTALGLYALSASKVPPDDPAIRKGLRWTEGKKASYATGTHSTYSASLLVLALTRIDPVGQRGRIHRLADSLVGGQLGSNMWTYQLGKSGTRGKGRGEGDRLRGVQGGDNSNSQFAVLALWAASALAGYEVPTATWQRIQAFYALTQLPQGTWGYTPPPAAGKATMTAAGLCAYVYATAGLLGGVSGLPVARKGAVAQRGLDALLGDLHPADYRNYYLVYAIERAGTVMAIPEDQWYVQGASALVQAQDPGGRWGPGRAGGGAYETSLALLFLSRATRAAVTRSGDGDGGRKITSFPGRVGPGQLEEALLYYMTAPGKERGALQPRFAEAGVEAVRFLVGKLRASDRDARVAAYELIGALVARRFLFEPDAKAEERDLMLVPIETWWQEQKGKLRWEKTKGRFVAG